ncbi:MAG: T9SS type A sorting domain-containing protein, partial [Bacteroidales bacterium]|nr:T9SS type A sorting domain-containing protein [Bacteroidales bacterium]
MKRLIVLIVALLPFVGLQAQDFTVVNSDGVSINYFVVSTTDHTVALAQGNYTGRVVVPETVVYNGVTWTVAAMQNEVFYNSSVTYVRLPGTIHTLGSKTFRGCTHLDSLRFDSEQPLTVNENYATAFGTSFPFSSLQVFVPCGHLNEWRSTSVWGRFRMLKSDCAKKLTVRTSMDSVVRAGVTNAAGVAVYGTSFFFEPGDTALLATEPFTWKVNNTTYHGRRGYFLGWSDGSAETVHPFVMPNSSAEMTCICDLMPYANLTTCDIFTPVYIFGNMSYDGSEPHYNFFNHSTGTLSSASTIFANSIWISGTDSNAAVGRFYDNTPDFFPGPLRVDGSASTDLETVRRFNRVWHVTRSMIDYHIAHCGEEDYVPIDDILTWPGSGDGEGYATQLAPFYDADSNGYYNAYAGDYPLIRGDECVFSIFNDAWGKHGESKGQSMGLEVHMMAYVFSAEENSAGLANTVFQHYDLFNRSNATHNGCYLGSWTDFDIGYGYDDYIGCDVKRGMYYGYNGRSTDGPAATAFDGVPPAQGCLVLGGPWQDADGVDNSKVDIGKIMTDAYTNTEVKELLEQYRDANGVLDTAAINRDADLFYSYDYNSWHFYPGDIVGNQAINGLNFGNGNIDDERIGMTNFVYYDNSTSSVTGEPSGAYDYYYYMRSFWKDGTHISFNGANTNYMYVGDSDPWMWGTDGVYTDSYNNYSEEVFGTAPGDRRGVASCGPFTFRPSGQRSEGASNWQSMDLAYVTAFDTSVYSGVVFLRELSDDVRNQWLRDTTNGGKAFTYMPYSAPHPVGVDEVAQSRLMVYPNPTTGMLTVALPVAADVRLYDMMGRCVMTVPASTPKVTLDLGNLPQGIYLLRA